MLKSIQIRIFLIIILLAIAMIVINSYFIINVLEGAYETPEEIAEQQVSQVRTIAILVIVSFTIISMVILLFTSRRIVSPISKLIKSAKKLAEGSEELGVEAFDSEALLEAQGISHKKGKTEIDELVRAFEVVTSGLKGNLNEVNRQKKQMEAILLHMTDGIVAFNISGEIVHINPAASRLLQVTSKEDTFDKIFKKLDVNINMEKIIYLEDWTSTEQKAVVG
ncbi:MAG: HAMP domain-containing protein, partial [Oscillospiraceae bacterium]|nr:HAMP domain-containing protein [Oscillospiraceae bacterium]